MGSRQSAQGWLIRFTNIIGIEAGKIRCGSTIISAILWYYIPVDDYSWGSDATAHEVFVNWNESTTWNTFGSQAGVQPGDYNTSDGVTAGGASGRRSVNVQASVQKWCDGALPNYGWIILPGGTESVYPYSSENTNTDYRPKLEVNYTPPSNGTICLTNPEPNSQTNPGVNVNLTVNLADFVNPTKVKFYVRESGAPFTLIHLPDTQKYTRYSSRTYQDEDGIYSGTRDTYILQKWTHHIIWTRINIWMGYRSYGNGNMVSKKIGLIKFKDIDLTLPSGLTLVSAQVEIDVVTDGESAHPATVYESLVDWNELATWNNFGNLNDIEADRGVQQDEYNTEAVSTVDVSTLKENTDLMLPQVL